MQWSVLNIIGPSCKAYSQLTSCLPLALNEHVTVGDIPLFHNTMFRIEHGQAYFSKKLVAEGLTTIGALDSEPWKQSLLQAHANMCDYGWASFILSASPKSFFPLIVSAQSSATRQPPHVWQAFNTVVIPRSTREFFRDSLWLKLKVGDKLKGWLPH